MAASEPSLSSSAEDELQSTDPADRQSPRPGMDGTRLLDVGQSALSSKENKIYQVIVNGLRGEEMIIDLCNTEEQMQKMTVLQLKEKILQRLPGHDDVACLALIFADEMLDGDSTLLCSYGIQHLSVIHVVIRLAQISSPTSDTEDEDSDASSSTQHEPSALSSKENKTYQVIVNGMRGEEVIIDLCNTEEQMQKMTVLQLKEKIIQRVPGHDDVERLRLIFTDRMLGEDSTLLCSYGIQHKSMIHLVMKLPGGAPPPSHPPPSKPRRNSIERLVSF